MATKTNSDKTMERAAKDVARMFYGDPSKVDEARLIKRCRQSPEYRAEFAQTAQLMAELEPLAKDPLIRSMVTGVHAKHRQRWPILAAAATVVLGIALIIWQQFDAVPPAENNVLRYVTRIGEQKTVSLADGSVITMNTGTQLIVDLSAERREVILERGEAYFDVAADPTRPFTVGLSNRAVSVLGTEFNIFKTPEKFVLAVMEGEVAIHGREDELSPIAPRLDVPQGEIMHLPHANQYRLGVGMVAELDERNNELIAYTADPINRLQSWRSGVLRFDEVPLYQVIQELNRYSAKKILIEDKSVMDLRVFATVRVGSPSMALTALERLLPIRVIQYFDRTVIVGENGSQEK